jgi:hypothetical protein
MGWHMRAVWALRQQNPGSEEVQDDALRMKVGTFEWTTFWFAPSTKFSRVEYFGTRAYFTDAFCIPLLSSLPD